MRNRQHFLIAIFLFFVLSCSKDGDNATQDNTAFFKTFNSQICNNVSGAEAVYWDISHGLPVALPEIPLVENPGQQFIHSLYPLLGFTIPQGFTAFEVTDQQTATIGVNVFRNDNNVFFRWVPNSQIPGQVDVNAIIASEINTMFGFYNFNGTPQVVCTTTSNSNFEGLPISFGARLIRFGNMTAQVWVRSTFTAGVTFFSISVSAAPTSEYATQTQKTFLPIAWQLLVGPERIQDSDMDGTPDEQDKFPFDPTRQ